MKNCKRKNCKTTMSGGHNLPDYCPECQAHHMLHCVYKTRHGCCGKPATHQHTNFAGWTYCDHHARVVRLFRKLRKLQVPKQHIAPLELQAERKDKL